MLRNTVDLQEIKNRQTFPKNNYFCYKWRILDNFTKSIDRQMFHLSIQGANNHRGLMSHKILQLYKSRYSTAKKDLIVDLAQDAMHFLNKRRDEHQRTSQVEVMFSNASRHLIDRAFNLLLAFSTELNTLLGLSELFITATEPEVKKRVNASATSRAIFVQGHLSTSLYRMVIEGRQDRVSFFIVPADSILALDDISLQFDAIATWQAEIVPGGDVVWRSHAGVLTEDMIDIACAELLRRLLEVTQERLSPECMNIESAANFNMSAPDPWLESQVKTPSDDFLSASGYGHELASEEEDRWAPVKHSHRYGQPAREESGWKPIVENRNDHYYETAASTCPTISITVSTSEPKPVPSKGTRTDSVPSLDSLMRQSSQYLTPSHTVQTDAFAEPVISEAPAGRYCDAFSCYSSEVPKSESAKDSSFASYPEYLDLNQPMEPQQKASKRSARKSNSKRKKK